MNPQTARFLIVDDKPEEGKLIADALWRAMLPVLFVPYDEKRLLEWQTRYTGVRAIFMDINLHQDGPVGPKDYGAVQRTIETLLDEKNGPYVLILWSSFNEKAPELFNHLSERLPSGKKPLWWVPLDKSPYLIESEGLMAVVTKILQQHRHLNCLAAWERSIHQGVSDVLHTISEIAVKGSSEYSDDSLGRLLYELAKAESGRSLERNNFIPSLHEVLGALLRDRLRLDKTYEFEVTEAQPVSLISWKRRINTMLHFDKSGLHGHSSRPGAVFDYPSQESALPVPKIRDEAGFIRENFFRKFSTDDKKKPEKERKQTKISAQCRLQLIDVTPPCDHAQKKAVWRRFIVAAKVQADHEDEIDSRSEFLYRLPVFQPDEHSFILIANSKLLLSIEDSDEVLGQLNNCNGRLREQLLTDMMGWLSRQISRTGITSLQ